MLFRVLLFPLAIMISLPTFSIAQPLNDRQSMQNVEVDCWSKSIDDDTTFRCSFVMIQGIRASDNKRLVPEVFASDDGGPKTAEQAWRLCRAMGFDYARRYELERATSEKWMITLSDSLREGELLLTRGRYIQNVNCQ